jgi:hypothetical protein
MFQPFYLCGHMQAVQTSKSQNYSGKHTFKGQTESSVLLYVNNKMDTSIWTLDDVLNCNFDFYVLHGLKMTK